MPVCKWSQYLFSDFSFGCGSVSVVLILMAKKYELPENEKAIGEHLREFRILIKLSQVEFANKAGIDATLLASYEHARARLNYTAAWRIIKAFQINPQWLATRQGRIWLPVPIPSPKDLNVGARTPFSEIYAKHLVNLVRDETANWKSKPPPEPTRLRVNAADPRERLMAEAKMVNWIKRLILCLPDKSLEAFLNSIYLPGTRRARSYQPDSDETFEKRVEAMDRARAQMESHKNLADGQLGDVGTAESGQENELTEPESREILSANVKPQLPSLLDRLNRATKGSGKMSALADFLSNATRKRVPLASVSRWLSSNREPGGEITLLMRHWVEQQERQNKIPGGVVALPGQADPKRKTV